jgi:hypothetical protein
MKPTEFFVWVMLTTAMVLALGWLNKPTVYRECKDMCAFGVSEVKEGNCTCWKMSEICPPKN